MDGDEFPNFLDTMLEVQMTEDDNALDVANADDRQLPPIPTFDFEYTSQLPVPHIITLPGPPMVSIHSQLFPGLLPAAPSPSRSRNVVTKQAFKSHLFNSTVTKVFNQEDVLRLPLSEACLQEMEFYKTCFKDLTKVQECKLHCTICDEHLGCSSRAEAKIKIHKMLGVLVCKECFTFYGDGIFPCDAQDNCEIYCRWCGQGGNQVCCSFCPKVFCKKCVRYNYGSTFLSQIEEAKDWACFCCSPRPLWPHRAICRALIDYFIQKKNEGTVWKDSSTCCVQTPLKRRKRKKKESITNGKPAKSTPEIRPKTLTVRNVEQINRTTTHASSSKEVWPTKNLEQLQRPINCGQTTITPPVSRALANSRASTSRQLPAVRSMPPLKVAPTAKSYQSPRARPPTPPAATSTPKTNETSNIPTAKVPHHVNGMILRMKFFDRTQMVRLVTDGEACDTCKTFPMPKFKTDANALERSLADSFEVNKMMFDRLMHLYDNVNAATPATEVQVYEATAKKLKTLFSKSRELFEDIEKDLEEELEEWKKQRRLPATTYDVIDLSDEEASPKKSKSTSARRTKIAFISKQLNDDSDIEIIEDEPEVRVHDDKLNNNKEKSVGNKQELVNNKNESVNKNEKFTNNKATEREDKEKVVLKECTINLEKLPVGRKRTLTEPSEPESKKMRKEDEQESDADTTETEYDEEENRDEQEVNDSNETNTAPAETVGAKNERKAKDAEKVEGEAKDAEKVEGEAKDAEKVEDEDKDAQEVEGEAKDAEEVGEAKDAQEVEGEAKDDEEVEGIAKNAEDDKKESQEAEEDEESTEEDESMTKEDEVNSETADEAEVQQPSTTTDNMEVDIVADRDPLDLGEAPDT